MDCTKVTASPSTKHNNACLFATRKFPIGTGIGIELELNFLMGIGIGIQILELTPALAVCIKFSEVSYKLRSSF